MLENPDISSIYLGADITDDISVSRNNVTIDGEGNTLTGKVSLSGNGIKLKNIKVVPETALENNSSLIEVTGKDAVLDGVTIDNMTTNVETSDSKNPIFAIKVAGENATVKNSKLNGPTEGHAYSMVFVDGGVKGPVTIEGNTFDNLENAKNVIEFNNGYKIEDGTVIKDNKFTGDVEHTAITMMNFEEGAYVTLENNELAGGIRISNTSGKEATIEFKGGKAVRNADDEGDWGYVLVQQVGNEDYSDMTIKVNDFKKENGSLYTDNKGEGKDLFCSLYSSTGAEHKIADDKAPVILFEQGLDKILVARDGNDITYGKKVSDLQENITVSNTGKISGTIKYATGLVGAAFTEGNGFAFHINKDYLPVGSTADNLMIGWNERARAKFDASDYNCTFRVDVDNRTTQPLKIWMNDEVIYEYDLSGLKLLKE